jgi:hypothetical protein
MFASQDEEIHFAGLVQEIISCIDTLPVDLDWAFDVIFGLGLRLTWTGNVAGTIVREWDDYRQRRRQMVPSGQFLWTCCSSIYLFVEIPQEMSDSHVFWVIDRALRDPGIHPREIGKLLNLETLLSQFRLEFRRIGDAGVVRAPNTHGLLLARLQGI